MSSKVIQSVETEEGAGAKVKRLFPTQYIENYDPFVLLDEFFVDQNAGFPDHEHRGFDAITYMLDGSFRHRDNLGNNSEVFAGGAQRFTAGRGIIHSEMPGKSKMNHGLQLWVNLPRRLKGIKPSYQQVNSFPQNKKEGIIIITIVDEKSPIKINTPVLYQDIKIKEGKDLLVELPKEFRGLLYMIDGRLERLKKGEALFFEKDIKIKSKTKSRFVLIAGKPHNEPIYQNGPFVD